MGQSIVSAPNSLDDAIRAIDEVARDEHLGRREASVLKALYVLGWHDGFVVENKACLARRLGLSIADVDACLDELASAGAVRRRPLPMGGDVIEIASLSSRRGLCDGRLGWRQYVAVDDGD